MRYEVDSSELTPEGRTILNGQAVWLRQYSNYPITIEGHADERGTREYNIALGARRAETTKNFLIAQGISPATDSDNLLWQGAPGGRLRQYNLLVAEQADRHRSRCGRRSRFLLILLCRLVAKAVDSKAWPSEKGANLKDRAQT